MVKTILKVGSFVMIVMGIVKVLSGDGTGSFLVVAGTIADLQAGHMDLTERILALESKEKKNGTEPT